MTDDEKFWQQIEGDARRTVICEPHRAEELQAALDKHGYDHITLRASPACPQGQLLVIDEPALEASGRQALQRSIRRLYP